MLLSIELSGESTTPGTASSEHSDSEDDQGAADSQAVAEIQRVPRSLPLPDPLTFNSKMQKTHRRNVSFSEVSIREFAPTVSDNPGGSGSGVPVQLSWNYEELPVLSVDTYEKSRPGKSKKPCHFFLNCQQRTRILHEAGFTKVELKEAEKSVCKAKRQRKTTSLLIPVMILRETLYIVKRRIKNNMRQQRTGINA
jgi:hypothetical protein